MTDYLIHFVNHGDPNGLSSSSSSLPRWENYTSYHPFMRTFTPASGNDTESTGDPGTAGKIGHKFDTYREQEIEFINYSPPFQAPLALDTPPALYDALGKFARMLEDPAVRFEYLLREGDAMLFDNRRVLHARTAFTEREAENSDEETNRWLKGCYLEADAVLDRGRVLRKLLEESASR